MKLVNQFMFCHKCGQADQSPETYCRQCGTFLPDLSKPVKKTITPQEHVTANLVLSIMTVVACFTLAVLMFTMLAFKGNTHPLIYATSGLLIAMGIWHIQTVWRTLQLRKHFKKQKRVQEFETPREAVTGKLLDEADFADFVPATVTEQTTHRLSKTKRRSSQAEH